MSIPGHSKFAGVRGSMSDCSDDCCVIGLLFIMSSMWVVIVLNVSRSTSVFPRIAFRCLFVICTMRSQHPPLWGACGAFWTHSMGLSGLIVLVFSCFCSSRACFIRFSAPIKFVPWSE